MRVHIFSPTYCQIQTDTYQEHCQLNSKGICHLPLWSKYPVLLWLLTFNNFWGSSVCSVAFCAPGKLVGQVFTWLDAFRNKFYDLNPCISSYLEKHQMPSWWHQIFMTNKKPFVKWLLNGIELPLHQNLIYWPSPTASGE